MKKLIKTFFSVLFAFAMTSPGSALATTVQEYEAPAEEKKIGTDHDNYTLDLS